MLTSPPRGPVPMQPANGGTRRFALSLNRRSNASCFTKLCSSFLPTLYLNQSAKRREFSYLWWNLEICKFRSNSSL
ncbi:unnamed protein product [Strongylus vulgaris]|uniref:Uncharacterized protein n=1 Tax=Strongylus vulgaris TaxID=40348 RepID=A0A3P7KMG4_STRVU|nr:unnamed protein product [Strongylus vulgaris]